MYVFIGCRGKSVKRNICCVIDETSLSDQEAISFAVESFKLNEEVTFVEIWDDKEGQYVCGIDFLR